MNVTLRDVNISKEGRVIVAGKEESGRTEIEREEGTQNELGLLLTFSQGYHISTESEDDEEEEEEQAASGEVCSLLLYVMRTHRPLS